MIRRFLRFLPLTSIIAFSVVAIGIGAFVHQKKVLTAELLLHPSRQLDTIWKNDESDIIFIVGDGEEANNFRAFAFWDGTYVDVSFTCDYARQAEIAIPGENGIVSRYDGATYLVVGTYHISADQLSIEINEELSSMEFVGERDTIVLHRFFNEEMEKNSELKQLVSVLEAHHSRAG